LSAFNLIANHACSNQETRGDWPYHYSNLVVEPGHSWLLRRTLIAPGLATTLISWPVLSNGDAKAGWLNRRKKSAIWERIPQNSDPKIRF